MNMNDILTPVNAAKAMWLVLLVHGTLHAVSYYSTTNSCKRR